MSNRTRLRAPTTEERRKGLPTSKADAIKAGLTRFIPEDGEERIIRNYGSRARPSGNIALATTRDDTRDSKTSLGLSRRTRNEKISTPRSGNRRQQTIAYQRARQAAKSAGKDHHHKTPVFLTGNALAQMDRRRRATYHRRMRKAGTPTGNTAENVSAETRGPRGSHRRAHIEGEALQNRLKIAEQQNPSPSLNRRSRASQLGANRIPAPTPSRATFTPRQVLQAASQGINDLQAIQEARVNGNQHLPAPRIGLI